MIDDRVLAELERLEKVATGGPWHACQANRETEGVCPCASVFAVDGPGVFSAWKDDMGDPILEFKDVPREQREQMAINMDFIAALRTHAAALLSEARAAKVLREEVRAWRQPSEGIRAGTNRRIAVAAARLATDSAGALGGEA